MRVEQINAGGINGLGEGLINTNSKDFKHLKDMIKSMSNNYNEEQRIENEFLSIRFQMESYLTEEIVSFTPAGRFIERYLEVIKIKKKDFASYIGYDDTNLNAVIKGRRKINTEMAIKLGKIFSVNPSIWLHLESKNELQKTLDEKKTLYSTYSLVDLMRKAV
ncbi:MAG: hypothetical protein AAFZ63_02875 [Bacteroidota bacterium]